MRILEWHPLVVHFPLALIVTATLLLSAARLRRAEPHAALLAGAGTVNLCVGAVGAVLAFATGLAAILGLTLAPAARLAVATHVKWAVLSATCVLLLAVWRAAGEAFAARPSRLFVLLLWLATAALTVTGYRGGVNVYRYGVGVEQHLDADPRR